MQGLQLDFRDQIAVSFHLVTWLERVLEPEVEKRLASAQVALNALTQKQTLVSSSFTKALLAIVAGTVGVTLTAAHLVNSYRWQLTGRLGLAPPASICGDTLALEQYLASGGNPSKQIPRVSSDLPLINCVLRHNNLEAAQRLVNYGAADRDGRTELLEIILADREIAYNAAEMMASLLDAGAEATPNLWGSIVEHDDGLAIARIFIEHSVETDDDTFSYPLKLAVSAGQPEIVRLLLDAGADPNFEDSNLFTLAAQEKNGVTIAHILLDYGATATPADALKFRNAPYLLERILGPNANGQQVSSPGNLLIHRAVQTGTAEQVQILISQGADITAANATGETPIYLAVNAHAAEERQAAIVKLLIQQGADVNVQTPDGVTPLHAAAWKGAFEIVKALVESGAQLEATTDDGATPLHAAANSGSVEVVEYLLQQGANIGAQRLDGGTLLHTAAAGRSVDTVRFLIQQGADVNATRDNGSTPLHDAIHVLGEAAAKVLIEHGADVNAKRTYRITAIHSTSYRRPIEETAAYAPPFPVPEEDRRLQEATAGWTPLHLAVVNKVNILTELLEKGADPHARADGSTALQMAIAAEERDAIAILKRYTNP